MVGDSIHLNLVKLMCLDMFSGPVVVELVNQDVQNVEHVKAVLVSW